MANKALATRQRMMLRVDPAPLKPRNPFAGFARQRSAGSHAKPVAAERQAAKRALKKVKLTPDEE
ncbi:hypothetical protein SRABI118_02055 [Massilia sp. Bi118]|uniref:hypothetical protein n=1 Tax=Massilia sp. Bi118 TaxID=2822346 RepID=UPI001E101A65|nr:hypothetical protein [Massilia sp. Bi118]CAH0214054.1 hypothetical protein SRABI118_02055 [Massilia sp. Bi118]